VTGWHGYDAAVTADAPPLDENRDVIAEAATEAAGVEHLRPGQREAVEAALTSDTVAVLASGTGKTAIYETVAHLLGGPALVISPTIALQRDQVQSLREHGHRATAVSSARTESARAKALEDFAAGRLDMLLVAPEQLANAEVVDALDRAHPALLVVDEAHCVSEWGHSFRPDYLLIGSAVERLHHPRVLALTATAAPRVRHDIVERLDMRQPRIVVGNADRPEIWLGARLFAGNRERDEGLVEAALAVEGSVILYAPTHRRCAELVDALTAAGRPAAVYHAGLPSRQRRQTADDFLCGRADTIVATSAFGMGVDRPDVRAVLHAGPPTSVDEYFQEAGRAGRDGEQARAELFFRLEDFALGRYLEAGGGVKEDDLRHAIGVLWDADGPIGRAELAERAGLSRRAAALVVGVLDAGNAIKQRRGRIELRAAAERDPQGVVEDALAERERRREFDRTRLDMIRAYAETLDCRRRVILELLGEDYPERCLHCDNCDAGTSEEASDRPYPIGSTVAHPEWGQGTVSHYEADRVVVLFADAGYRTLALTLVREKGLLTAA
jgi:ATP-dependent DNA helicase RecQ